MALYQKITITRDGQELMNDIIINGGKLTFEAVAVGSGELPTDTEPETISALIQEVRRLPVDTVETDNGRATITARLATDSLTNDLIHREVGIFANGVLFAYGNAGNDYDYIPAAGSNAAVQKIIRVPLVIGSIETAFAEMDTSDLVTHAALEARVRTIVEPITRDITEDIAHEALTDATRELAAEISEQASVDAYNAQVKAEQAAAKALVAEQNIEEMTFELTHAAIIYNIREMFPEGQAGYGKGIWDIREATNKIYSYLVENGKTDLIKWGFRIITKYGDDYEACNEYIWCGENINQFCSDTGLALADYPTFWKTYIYPNTLAEYAKAKIAGTADTIDSTSESSAPVGFSAEKKMFVPAASATKAGGVLLATGLDDTRATAVPTASQVSEALTSLQTSAASETAGGVAKIYTSFDDVLDANYGTENLKYLCFSMEAGTQAKIIIAAGEIEAPCDGAGILEVTKLQDERAIVRFIAADITSSDHYEPAEMYVGCYHNFAFGAWKKMTFSAI